MSYQNTMIFSPANLDGCGLWRMFLPHINLANSGFFFTQGKFPVDKLARHDVIAVQRLMSAGNKKFLDLMRKLGLRIVYDLDDNLWSLQDSNPAKQKLEKYLQGLVYEGDEYGLESCLAFADVVTVSTNHLKKMVKRYLGETKNTITKRIIPIEVIENYVDPVLFRPSGVENEEVVIGWGGSNTHQGDVGEVWDLLPEILMKYRNVRMEFVGHPPPDVISSHPRVSVRSWVHIAEYAQTLSYWNWDIFLAPLDSNKFNSSKSCIKQLEAAALGKPCLASFVENYVAFANSAEEKSIEPGNIRWSLCATKIQWKDRLEYLIENKQARLDLGARMREHVLANYDISKQAWRWQHVCDLAAE